MKPYQVMEFQLRRNINFTLEFITIQIHPYLNGSNIIYNIYLFGENDNIGIIKKGQSCLHLLMAFTTVCVDVICEDRVFNQVQVMTRCVGKKLWYLFEGPRRTFIC